MVAESTGAVIERCNYSHEKLIELLITHPRITQRELSRIFGYSEGWLSQIVRSDAFREMYEKRRGELVDPTILMGLEQRFQAASHRALDILIDDLDTRKNPDVALKVLSESRQALGMGTSRTAGGGVQVNFVVAMPEKAESADSWLAAHRPESTVVDVTPSGACAAGGEVAQCGPDRE